MHTRLKCILYIYFKDIYTLLLTYSYTVYMYIKNSIHVPPNLCHVHVSYDVCVKVSRDVWGHDYIE